MVFFSFLGLITFWGNVRFMPFVIRIVKKLNLLDKPNERKLHTMPKASMGGLGVVGMILIIIIPILALDYFDDFYFIVLTLLTFALLGFVDDWKNVSAKIKLLLQILFASTAFLLGGFGVNRGSTEWGFNY